MRLSGQGHKKHTRNLLNFIIWLISSLYCDRILQKPLHRVISGHIFAYIDFGDENLKTKLKLYLFFAFLFLFGTFLAAGLYFAYDVVLMESPSHRVGSSLSLSDYMLLTCQFIEPLLFMFLSAFTLFACAVNGASCFFIGLTIGQTIMPYCLSTLTPFTHAAGLIFLLGFGALYTVLSVLTAQYRHTLKTAAPEPKLLLHNPDTLSLFYSFLAVCAITMTLVAALYFFLYYFPL